MKGRMIALGAVGILLAAMVTVAWRVLPGFGSRAPDALSGPPTMRLISAEQYYGILRDLFGDNIEVEVSFPVLQRQDGLLALGRALTSITPGAFEQFDRAALL